jgi:hypothetical protein
VAARAHLTPQAIELVASAIFAKPDPWVAEAYSGFDEPPRQFATPAELVEYAAAKVSEPDGLAFLVVVYPDMRGRPEQKIIHLKPNSSGHVSCYTWDGWGLISVQLTRADRPELQSRIASNSERRAVKWAATNPAVAPPSVWNWAAVASHTRRLQRVLGRVA